MPEIYHFFQQLVNGLTIGSTYALIAIGYTMVYGIIGMINFAHGEVLMVGALTGLGILLLTGAVDWKHADDVFTNGMKMMALIGFIMITAQGFASVMTATNEVGPLVDATANLFGTNKVLSWNMVVISATDSVVCLISRNSLARC